MDGEPAPAPPPIHEPGYAPQGAFAWDFWLLSHEGVNHVYHLRAPRRGWAGLRHLGAQVGHATSVGLSGWQDRGPVLGPGPRGTWDDGCIWTGSTVLVDGLFYLYYTGLPRFSLRQRVGLAVSSDGHDFSRVGSAPVLEADPRWYATGAFHQDWRDPYVLRREDRFQALLTARVRQGGRYGGCVALATSLEGTRWQVHPPVLSPGWYTWMECPQVTVHEGRFYLTFVAEAAWCGGGAARRTGLHGFVSSHFHGPWEPLNGDGWVRGQDEGTYGTRVVAHPTTPSGLVAIPWISRRPGSRAFVGRIGLPRVLHLVGDGRAWMEEPLP